MKALGLTGQAAEDFLAEEALTEAIADGGQAIMNQNTGTLAALKTFIADMWQMIKDAFQLNTWQDMGKLQNLTLDDYAQIVANTMLSGEQVVGEEVQIDKPLFQVIGEIGASRLENAEMVLADLNVAKQMEAAGKTPKEIYLATGWEKGVGQKWRYEILDGRLKGKVKSGTYKVGDIYEGELLKAHPEIADIQVRVELEPGRNFLVFGEGTLTASGKGDYFKIELDVATQSKLKSILEHELMHVTQFKEGFPRGGSYHDVGAKKTFLGQLFDIEAYLRYRKIAGEVEARNVEKRMGMAPEERKAKMLVETEDVAREEQIILQGAINGTVSASYSMGVGITGDVSEEERFGVDFNADVRAKLAPLTTTLTAGSSITPELENALAGVLNTKDPSIAEAEKAFVNNLIRDIQKALATSSKPTAQVLKEEMQKGEAKFATDFKGEDIKQFYALTAPIGEVVKESMLDTVTERVGGNGKVGTVVGEVLDAVRSSAKKISEVRGQRKQALADRKLSGNKPSVIGGYSAKGWAQGGKVARAVASPVSKFFAEEVSAMSDFFDFFGARYIKKIMPFLDRKITSLFPNADKTAIAKKLRNMAATGNFAARAVERLASSLVFGAAKTADQVRENEYKNGLTRLGQLLSNNLVDLLNAVLYDPSLQMGSVPGYSEEELRQMAIQQSRARVYVALNPSVLQIMTFDEFDALAGKRIKRWADYSDTTKQDKYKEYRETVHNQAAKLGITYNKGSNTPNFGISDLTPSEQEAMKIVRNVMDLVHDISFITGNLGFGTYINNVDNYMPRLIDLKEENTNDPEYEKFMRGVPENTGMVLGIYNKRADEMDAFIQLNTIMDAAMAAKVRVQQVFKNKAINDYAQFVVDDTSLKDMVSSTQKPGYVKLPVAGFGALNGKYVAAPIADDLRGFMYFTDSQQSWLSKTLNKLGNAFEAYDSHSFRQFLRLKNTVLNPRVAVANFTTGLTMASIAGIDPLTQMKFFSKLFSDGKESLLTSDLYARLVAKGLLGNGISYVDFFKRGEDKLTLAKDEALLDAYRAGTLGDKDFRERILALMNENVLAEAYAMTDEYHKAAAFLALREMGMAEDVAIETVKKQFQNMERVAPLFARISKTPGMNMFFRWAYQSKYIMTNGLRNHPLTTVATMTAMMAIPGILSNLIGEDEDKKTLREGKGSAGNFFGMRIPGQWTYMLDGVQKVADMGRFFLLDRRYEMETDDKGAVSSALESMDPTGFTKLGYYDWLTTFGEKTPASALNKYDRPSPIDKDSFFEWLNASSKDPVVNVITQVVFGMDFNNRDLINAGVSDKFGLKKINTNSIGAELFPRVAHLLRQIVPAVSDLQDIYFAMNDEPDYYNRWKTPTDAVLGLVGLKVQTVNDKTLQQQATRILDTYARSFKELGKQANAEFKQADKALEKVDNIVLSFSQDTNIDPAELDKRIKQKSESAIKEYERSINRAQAVRAEQIAVFEGLLNTYRIIDRLHWYEVTEKVLSANKLSGASGEAALVRELEDVKELVVELQKAEEALKTKERRQEIEETVRENVTRQLK